MVGELARERHCAHAPRSGPSYHLTLERDRSQGALGQGTAPVRYRTQRRKARREKSIGRAAGVQSRGRTQQRAQGEQVVAEPVVLRGALAAQLEAPQRPGDLARVWRATRDEIAEGTQLVLLLGAHHKHSVRVSTRAKRDRGPRR